MATKKKAPGKKKAASKKALGKAAKGKKMFQTDDPIIVKPGASITLDFEKKFGKITHPKPNKRLRHKHPTANALTHAWIFRDGVGTDYPLNPGDWVVICYDLCQSCPDESA